MDGQGDGAQGMSITGGGGRARVPNLCVQAPMSGGWHTGVKTEFASCRVPPVRRKEG